MHGLLLCSGLDASLHTATEAVSSLTAQLKSLKEQLGPADAGAGAAGRAISLSAAGMATPPSGLSAADQGCDATKKSDGGEGESEEDDEATWAAREAALRLEVAAAQEEATQARCVPERMRMRV